MPNKLNHLRRELLQASYRLATATNSAQRYWRATERALLVEEIRRARGKR